MRRPAQVSLPAHCARYHAALLLLSRVSEVPSIRAALTNGAGLPARFFWELSPFTRCALGRQCPVEPAGFAWRRKLHIINRSPLLSNPLGAVTGAAGLLRSAIKLPQDHFFKMSSGEGRV